MAAAALPDTRTRLLAVAEETIAELGPAAVSLREVARRAGLSHGAPLRHFSSLANLLSVVAADGFVDLQDSVRAALDAAGPDAPPRARLSAATAGYVRFAHRRPAVFALMFRPDVLDPNEPSYAREGIAAFAQLQAVVEECQRAGWNAGEAAAPLAGSLWSVVHGIAGLTLQGALQGVTSEPRLDAHVDLALRLLALPPAPPSIVGAPGAPATTAPTPVRDTPRSRP